jgi:uncharacterized glyoxalase superfamily protein PhnB
MGIVGPAAIGGTPVTLSLYVEDVDDVFARALAAGATPLRPVQDQFYGDRMAVRAAAASGPDGGPATLAPGGVAPGG